MYNLLIKRLLLLTFITAGFISICMPSFASTGSINSTCVQEKLAALEASSGGRLGISATSTYQRIQYRANEPFPFCSTFKVMVVSDILKQSMTNSHLLQEKIIYTKKDVDSSKYSPITKNHIANGMTIAELDER